MMITKLVVAVCTIHYGLLCTLPHIVQLNSSYLAQKQERLVFITKMEYLPPVWSAYATEMFQKMVCVTSPCVILPPVNNLITPEEVFMKSYTGEFHKGL